MGGLAGHVNISKVFDVCCWAVRESFSKIYIFSSLPRHTAGSKATSFGKTNFPVDMSDICVFFFGKAKLTPSRLNFQTFCLVGFPTKKD